MRSSARTITILRGLREGDTLRPEDAHELLSGGATEWQLAAAAAAVQQSSRTSTGDEFLVATSRRHPIIGACLRSRSAATADRGLDLLVQRVLRGTGKQSAIGRRLFVYFLDGLLSGSVPSAVAAFWLMGVCRDGLSGNDTTELTRAMVASGRVYDYRQELPLRGRRFIRRYPTGALSEKGALVIPALLASLASSLPIASPFLVGRSLGFTGGTWDKLKAIPGFAFPAPGETTLDTLRACGVAMTVAQNDVCPADRLLYELRSATSTIEAPELIAASIASKQLAVPVDCLLLDVRFGGGAFIPTRELGTAVALQIKDIVLESNTDCSYLLTDTARPGGSALGNALEVCEALALMGIRGTLPWNEPALVDQAEKIVTLFATLMTAALPDRVDNWRSVASEQFRSGAVVRGFANILSAHGVSDDNVAKLLCDPEGLLLSSVRPLHIRARVTGVVAPVDQRTVGSFVNFSLGAGGNDFVGTFRSDTGVLLRKRAGDLVLSGDILADLYAPPNVSTDDLERELAQIITAVRE